MSRNKLSPEAKKIFLNCCKDKDVHSTLNVTFEDVALRIFSWLKSQNDETWNEVISILETELNAGKNKCFTGRLSRLISCIDGFHPGVRISIATSDQISNRVLIVIENCKKERCGKETTIQRITAELKDLEMNDEQIKDWTDTIDDDMFESIVTQRIP